MKYVIAIHRIGGWPMSVIGSEDVSHADLARSLLAAGGALWSAGFCDTGPDVGYKVRPGVGVPQAEGIQPKDGDDDILSFTYCMGLAGVSLKAALAVKRQERVIEDAKANGWSPFPRKKQGST